MVARFHDAGLEVIIDVVYNHTAEGNELGPTLSFKGIDNASYYRLMPDKALLHQRHRHRQYAESLAPGGDPDGVRQPALLGAGDARRRLPLRPRHHPRARAERVRHLQRLHEGGHAGPGARQGEADRRALGLRPGRLPARALPAGWAEWNDQFRDTVRDYWRGEATPARSRRGCAARPTSSTAAGASRGRASTSSPRTTASLSTTSSHTTTSTTRRTARKQGRPFAQPLVEPRRRGTHRRRSDPRPAQAPDEEHARHAAALAGHADAARRRRVRPQPARQQQRLLPGQRDLLAALGARRPGAAPDPLRAADRPAQPLPDPAARASLRARSTRSSA